VRAALERAREGRGAVVRLVGEPGIGKTRLADEACALAEGQGMRVAWGRCWEAGGAPAYWPWRQIVRTLGLEAAARELAELARPASPGAAAGVAPPDAEEARFRVHEGVAEMLEQATDEAPILLVFDDLHAGDAASLSLLQFVARGLRNIPLLVLATHREVEARVQPEVGAILAKLGREGETILLPRLAEPEVAEWLRRAGRSEEAALRVHRATEGNPLFVQEVLEVLRDASGAVPIPDAVRSAIAEHLGRLSARTREVLAAMAVVGREASHADLARLVPATAREVDEAMRDAVAFGVADARDGGAFAFRHILLRDELYALLDAARRAELHARVGAMFADRAALGDVDALASAAHHELEAATLGGDAERAIASARKAAAGAIDRVAYEQAEELLGRALALLEARCPDSPSAAGLLVDRGEALILVGAGWRGRELCARGAALAKAAGAKDLMVRAALVYGSEILTGQRDERMVALCRDALEAVGPEESSLRARVMSRLASALIPGDLGDAEFSARMGRESIEMARRVGDPHALVHALHFGAGGLAFLLGAKERAAMAREAVDLAEALGRPALAAASYPWLVSSSIELGPRGAADDALDRLARLVATLRQPTYRIRLPIMRATRASHA
jgi:hypothetical protein